MLLLCDSYDTVVTFRLFHVIEFKADLKSSPATTKSYFKSGAASMKSNAS